VRMVLAFVVQLVNIAFAVQKAYIPNWIDVLEKKPWSSFSRGICWSFTFIIHCTLSQGSYPLNVIHYFVYIYIEVISKLHYPCLFPHPSVHYHLVTQVCYVQVSTRSWTKYMLWLAKHLFIFCYVLYRTNP
jgi:hypothetical protein